VNAYFLRPLPSDFGRAFSLTKLVGAGGEAAVYHVLLDGRRSSCDCPGHDRYGRCKHMDSLRFLLESGQLHGPAAVREAGSVGPGASPGTI
jgi:hypothetical protein